MKELKKRVLINLRMTVVARIVLSLLIVGLGVVSAIYYFLGTGIIILTTVDWIAGLWIAGGAFALGFWFVVLLLTIGELNDEIYRDKTLGECIAIVEIYLELKKRCQKGLSDWELCYQGEEGDPWPFGVNTHTQRLEKRVRYDGRERTVHLTVKRYSPSFSLRSWRYSIDKFYAKGLDIFQTFEAISISASA